MYTRTIMIRSLSRHHPARLRRAEHHRGAAGGGEQFTLGRDPGREDSSRDLGRREPRKGGSRKVRAQGLGGRAAGKIKPRQRVRDRAQSSFELTSHNKITLRSNFPGRCLCFERCHLLICLLVCF